MQIFAAKKLLNKALNAKTFFLIFEKVCKMQNKHYSSTYVAWKILKDF